jgi:hypothetical protein
MAELPLKTKLLIYEYKERYPMLSPNEIAKLFCISEVDVVDLFVEGEIIVPSRLNKK